MSLLGTRRDLNNNETFHTWVRAELSGVDDKNRIQLVSRVLAGPAGTSSGGQLPLQASKRRKQREAVDPGVEVIDAGSFLDKGRRAALTAQAADAMLWWLRPQTVPGMHDFLPEVGPMPEPGRWARPKAGVARWGMR